MKTLTCLLATFAVTAAFAENVTMRIHYGTPQKIVRTETLTRSLVATPDGSLRFTLPKDQIPAEACFIDVLPDFMTATKGDAGYWLHGRGTYGHFDKDNGTYTMQRHVLPIFGFQKADVFWAAHVKSWRFDYNFVTTAKEGHYETFARFKPVDVRRYFKNYYSDIIVDFRRLTGPDADYNGLARYYRQYQLDRGAVRTIKDRLAAQPELDYLCDAIVVRIQTHAAKPIPETADGITQKFFKRGEELPIAVHMPFGVSEEFLQAFKDAGIDKLSFCSAGWQDGGYDGRVPGHMPPCAEAGGKEAFLRLIARAQKLGYQFALHVSNTDGYMCSRLWSEDWVCKFADGTLDKGGLWAGGQCYWVCQKCAWARWLPGEMRDMAAMGIHGPHYIDVYSATYPQRCGDPQHLVTPEDAAALQTKVLEYGRELFGAAASEAGFDHVAGALDYINYIGRELKAEHEGGFVGKLPSGVFPLWELVYHGIILYTSDRLCQNHTRGKCLYKLEKSGDPRWMEGDGIEDPYVALKIVEFGGRPIFYTYKFADVPRVKKAWMEFLPVRHLQRELMTGHREIAPQVFETTYANGEATVCNYGATAYRLPNGRTVPSMGYILK